MKLTKVQKTTRFIIKAIGIILLAGTITGILPTLVLGLGYQILGI